MIDSVRLEVLPRRIDHASPPEVCWFDGWSTVDGTGALYADVVPQRETHPHHPKDFHNQHRLGEGILCGKVVGWQLTTRSG